MNKTIEIYQGFSRYGFLSNLFQLSNIIINLLKFDLM